MPILVRIPVILLRLMYGQAEIRDLTSPLIPPDLIDEFRNLTLLQKFRWVKTFEVFQKTGSKPGRDSENKIT